GEQMIYQLFLYYSLKLLIPLITVPLRHDE
ncbi:MAG: hypothetical protein ACJAV9_000884, partial [Urechidicola sp.]